jgi:hypothetical protein
MKIGRAVTALSLLCLLAIILGCGRSGNGTVQAQSSMYSNANVSGTYNLELSGVDSTTGFPLSGSGSLLANGSGQFASGSYSITEDGLTCNGSLSGSYSVSSNGSGNATISAVPNPASTAIGCASTMLNLSLAVSASGDTFAFSEADTTAFAAGVAVK